MTLASLAVFVLAIVGGTAFAVVRALELWRTIRAFSSALGGGLDELSRRLEMLEPRESRDRARLEVSMERLRRSRAQLDVLTNALRRVREQASTALVLYPRK